MEREWGNAESQSLSISSFSLHFLFISSFSLHFLAARLQGSSGLWHPGTDDTDDTWWNLTLSFGQKYMICGFEQPHKVIYKIFRAWWWQLTKQTTGWTLNLEQVCSWNSEQSRLLQLSWYESPLLSILSILHFGQISSLSSWNWKSTPKRARQTELPLKICRQIWKWWSNINISIVHVQYRSVLSPIVWSGFEYF